MWSDQLEKRVASSIFITLAPPRRNHLARGGEAPGPGPPHTSTGVSKGGSRGLSPGVTSVTSGGCSAVVPPPSVLPSSRVDSDRTLFLPLPPPECHPAPFSAETFGPDLEKRVEERWQGQSYFTQLMGGDPDYARARLLRSLHGPPITKVIIPSKKQTNKQCNKPFNIKVSGTLMRRKHSTVPNREALVCTSNAHNTQIHIPFQCYLPKAKQAEVPAATIVVAPHTHATELGQKKSAQALLSRSRRRRPVSWKPSKGLAQNSALLGHSSASPPAPQLVSTLPAAEVKKPPGGILPSRLSRDGEQQAEGQVEAAVSTGVCAFCHKGLSPRTPAVEAMNKQYHADCFACRTCRRALAGQRFYQEEGRPLCVDCYKSTLEKCARCQALILSHTVHAMGNQYHPECFTCMLCGRSIGDETFALDGETGVLCLQDFYRKFASVCGACEGAIIPSHGRDSYRVECLGRHFHEDCYRCEICRVLLSPDPTEGGCYPLGNHLLCKSCNIQQKEELSC